MKALLGNRGHYKTNDLPIIFKIAPGIIPISIKRPCCTEIEGKFTDFADNSQTSRRRHAANPDSNPFIVNCEKISDNFNIILQSILTELTVDDVNMFTDEHELDYDIQLQHFHSRNIDMSYINRITDEMIIDMNQRYNVIVRRLITQMAELGAARTQYVKLAKTKVNSLSFGTIGSVMAMLEAPQQTLVTALDRTIEIVNEFNLYRVELARLFMTL